MSILRSLPYVLAVALAATGPLRAEPVVVFAAASLGGALDEAAAAWDGEVTISYAGSATLARQVEAGAPADVILLANADWMDHLAATGAIDTGSRRDLLGNALVLVGPEGTAPAPDIAAALAALDPDARVATGFLDSVPAGIYARQSLDAAELLDTFLPRIVQVENVRLALALAARNDVAAAFVYRSDAMAEPRVAVIAEVPAENHDPITYPAAITARSGNPDAAAFLDHLSGDAAAEIFARHGFEVLR
ncbi:molybdate ABC transporter substrate-binding protein [Rhodobacterales bacterium HKCCE2091]|nr:molybdate ABC transporter substrate-binding protein [Rhodobacterales bacterium HKCCE2091]